MSSSETIERSTGSIATHDQRAKAANANVILLEFNELSPALIETFMGEGILPNFSKLHGRSQVFVTDAEEAAPNLEPWIQWVTFHSGQSFAEHGVFELGDGHKVKAKQVWDVLSDAGHKVWVCGSMNARYDAPINGAVLPDPWSAGTPAYPDDAFNDYLSFVRKNVQEHSNDHVPLTRAEYTGFLRFLLTHGVSLKTLSTIVHQLGGEKLGARSRWQRAVILDLIQFDLFAWYHRRNKPALSTFFLNSTAHFQHMFWRNMDPAPFKVKPTSEEQRIYQNAIRFGYQMMDDIVGRTLRMAGPDTTVILASALSQQPCLAYEDQGGKTFYRPRTFEPVLAYAGVEGPYTVEPVMSEQFRVVFPTEDAARAGAERLRALKIDGRCAMYVEQTGTSVMTGCIVFHQLDKDVVLTVPGRNDLKPFFELFYQAEGLKSGMHHPDGILWIDRPGLAPKVHRDKVPLRSVAPTILGFYGVEPPATFSGKPIEL